MFRVIRLRVVGQLIGPACLDSTVTEYPEGSVHLAAISICVLMSLLMYH